MSKQQDSWKAELLKLLDSSKVHCRVYNSPSWDPILGHMNPIYRDYCLLSGLIPPDLLSKGLFYALSHFRKKIIYCLERECVYFVIIKSLIVSRSRYVCNIMCVLLQLRSILGKNLVFCCSSINNQNKTRSWLQLQNVSLVCIVNCKCWLNTSVVKLSVEKEALSATDRYALCTNSRNIDIRVYAPVPRHHIRRAYRGRSS